MTVTATSSQLTSTPLSVSANPSANTDSKSPSMPISTVVAVCVGTFVGAVLLIFLSVLVYRRSARRLSRARSAARSGTKGQPGRSEAWKKIGEDPDLWEGKTPTSEKGGWKNSPVRPNRTSGLSGLVQTSVSNDHSDSKSSFSSYHPKLAEELSQPPRAFAGHKSGISSWGGSTVVNHREDPFSLHSVHIESGIMSPSLSAAKMTPPSTVSGVHRWESAEVIQPGEHQTPVNPFADTPQQPTGRKSQSNPFFGAQAVRRPTITRKTTQPPQNPFSDQPAINSIPDISHVPHDSVASNCSSASATDRAMKSLITALNLPQEVVEERLRIASMQPSETSRYSVCTADSLYGRESMMFPHPPQAR